MKIRKIKYLTVFVFFSIAVFFTGGCATMQENTMLSSAHNVYTEIQNNPDIHKYAPMELADARKAFEKARQGWEENHDPEEVSHLAYIAKQKALIAKEAAAMKEAENKLESASKERSMVLLSARASEAEKSLKQAEQARREAELARQEAEQAKLEALAKEEKAKKLEARIAELQAKQTQRGLVLTLGDVLFDTAKNDLKKGAYATIEELAEFLKEYPERRVLIEGHTDSVGGDQYNLGLSINRAEAARDALMEMGIDSARIQTKGYGKKFPVAGNDTPAGRQRNRRVEIIISDEKGVIKERAR